MISFGEIRKKSVEWHTELTTVEKIYARDWLLKGIFDRPRSAGIFLRALLRWRAPIFPDFSGWDYLRHDTWDGPQPG